MTEQTPFIPIVQHKSTGAHYFFRGGTKFENAVTGQAGEVDEEKASKAFVMNLELSDLANENHCIMDLIRLGFRQSK